MKRKVSPVFEAFKRRLASTVRRARARGVKVSRLATIDGPRAVSCPLGCHPECGPKPGEWDAAPAWGITQQQAFAFACGFDGDELRHLAIRVGPRNPYYLLGREYARRFP